MAVKEITRHWTTTGDLIAEARYVSHQVGSFYSVAPTSRPSDLRFVVLVDFRDGFMLTSLGSSTMLRSSALGVRH